MKRTLAAAAVLVAVLAPAGAASAEVTPYATGNGTAWGNCQHSSAGGDLDPIAGKNDGNGGMVEVQGADCLVKAAHVKKDKNDFVYDDSGAF